MLRRSRTDEEGSGAGRVLVVDDDPDAAETMRRLLDSRGFVVDVVEGPEAVAVHLGAHPADLVLIDLHRGGTSAALTLLDQLRMSTDPDASNVRVVIATDLDENRVFSWQSGVDGFLVRPYHADDLVQELVEVLERSDEARVGHRQDQIRAGAEGRGRRLAGGATF